MGFEVDDMDIHLEHYDLDELYWDNLNGTYETKCDINKRNENLDMKREIV